MYLCNKCKKRPAIVFISSMTNGIQEDMGYCLSCAKELNISNFNTHLERLGLSADDIESMEEMSEQMFGMLEEGGMVSGMNPENNEDTSEESEEAGKEEGDFTEEDTPKRKSPFRRKRPKPSKGGRFLEGFCTNLSERANNGELDRIVGRDREVSRVIQILSRRTKNNPCLIGEPGVGKTAIAEGIAQRIVSKNVPFSMLDKQVFLLDMTALVAGTQYRGQFESRVKGLLKEIKEKGNVILFIDEVHSLVAAGDSEGAMSAANILKPALSRGEVQVIGATTFKEYRKYIEKDSALERRFQPVTVKEPTVLETIEVLMGVRGYYEAHHRVKLNDSITRLCAVLSERYITDRFLPDKAIDLLDESCAYRSIRSKELGQLAQTVRVIEDDKSRIAELQEAETPDYEQIADLKAEMSRLCIEKKRLEEEVDRLYVEESDLATVIELWTGIPANKIQETEVSRLKNLEERLSARVIGQTEAVHMLATAIKRNRMQLSQRIRPASFIFVGPTGVGKTELVKVLSSEMFSDTEPLVRFNMTEFMEKHSVSRLIGSPPGYVGYEEAGQLTEKIRRKPYSVILFDEIEKAHPDVMHILMQILDEGQIEDAQGRLVSFAHTVICMTSNAGSTDTSTGVGFTKTVQDISRERAMKGLKEFLRPEFLSRIDEVIVFRELIEEDFANIAALMIEELRDPLLEKGITMSYERDALEAIAHEAFGKKYGAREIRKIIRARIEDCIAEEVIDNERTVQAIRLYTEEKNDFVKVEFS